MKDIKQLIKEQREQFLSLFGEAEELNKQICCIEKDCLCNKMSYLEAIDAWHTTSLKSLLLALRDESKKERRELPPDDYLPKSEAELVVISIKVGKNQMADKFSSLITEVINSLEE